MSVRNGDLTVLLPLKGRADYTQRWMEYAEATFLPFKVLIADGSQDDGVAALLADRHRYPHVDYEYLRYEPDQHYADYYAKLEDASSRIRTPYAVMIDNDDFLVADALSDALRFLDAHPSHVACGGQFALFWLGQKSAHDNALHGGRIEWKAHRCDASNAAQTARERLRELALGDSETCFYLVKRTALLQAQFRSLRELSIDDLFLMETLLYFLTTIAGKTERLGGLQIARQMNSPGSSAGRHAADSGDSYDRVLSPTWSSDFGKFLRATGAALAERDAIAPAEARRLVIAAYRSYAAIPLYDALLAEPTITMRTAVVYPLVRRAMAWLTRLPAQHVLRSALRRTFRLAHWIPYEAVQGGRLVVAKVPDAAAAMASIDRFLATRRSSKDYAGKIPTSGT